MSAEKTSSTSQVVDIDCVVCMENVKDKSDPRYGLLSFL